MILALIFLVLVFLFSLVSGRAEKSLVTGPMVFAAQSWFIDMNLGIWTKFTLSTFLSVIWRMFVNAIGGAFAGLLVALVYNAVAAVMGGIKMEVE
jgi:hypothetical protein